MDTLRWEEIITASDDNIPCARYFHSADAWNDKLIIFGGMSYHPDSPNPEELCVLDDIHFFDITTRRWLPAPQGLSALSPVLLPPARYAHLSSVTADRLFIIGGQDFNNKWIDDVCVYDLVSRSWVLRRDYPRQCGMHRSFAITTNIDLRPLEEERRAKQEGATLALPGQPIGVKKAPNQNAQASTSESPTHRSDSALLNIKRELDFISPLPTNDFTVQDTSVFVTSTNFPPGLRFPTGALLNKHLIIAGTYLGDTYQSFSMYALNLTTMAWSRINPGKAIESGSWFRGALYADANRFIIFGNRSGNLMGDYDRRLLSWDHVILVDLEAFGLPRPPLARLRSSQTESLVNRIQTLLRDKNEYKRLLACKADNAQRLLDIFQRLLDLMVDPPPGFQRNLIVATQRLASASGLYPVSYELAHVTIPEIPECSGGFADIYKGSFRGRAVCVKTIRLHKNTHMAHFVKVVSKEAILWSQLRHPNLLPFYGIYRHHGRISLVAPWMENGDISEYLRRHQTSKRVVLAYDVARGLEFLHENGIIHGDLKGVRNVAIFFVKPNILVNELGRACLADFGLSSISDKEILAWTSYSSAASKGGTVRWQAPELFDPEGDEEKRNTEASDMYAWACVAYEIFAGQVPFAHLTREATIIKQVTNGEQPARPSKESSSWSVWGLTEGIWSLMKACWGPQPEARPSVRRVINYLAVILPPSLRSNASVSSLSPGEFRELMRRPLGENEMSVQTFERLLLV
ncbi:hypothetical protein H0H87_008653 [Tephrocybe sp. NHM501043]|nr:hypothetical protein H0H87_008653 [Tephrocybe sp. NHM501043]